MREWIRKLLCRHDWETIEVLNSGDVVCRCKKCGKKMLGHINCHI